MDRGHFKLVLNEYRVSRTLDPSWQAGTDAGAGDGAANKFPPASEVEGSTRTRRRREARRRQKEAGGSEADSAEPAATPTPQNKERPTQAAPKENLENDEARDVGEGTCEQSGGDEATVCERSSAAQAREARTGSGSERREKKANREERDKRDEQDDGHVATLAGAAVDAGRAGGEVQIGTARGYGAGEGVGGGVQGARTNGLQGESSTLQEQYVAGEVGPHGGKMELLVRRFSKRWIERCVLCDGSGWQECESCDSDGYWSVEECSERVEVRRALQMAVREKRMEWYKQIKSGLSGEVQSQAGTAPHRTGVGRQTYASAARSKTSGGANQTTAGDGRRGK